MNIKTYIFKKINRNTYNNLILFRSYFRKYHGLNKIDKKISRYIQKYSGFYIELGANDGISQSNTLFFERSMGWKGILIEPDPNLFELCKKNRRNNIIINAACVNNLFKGESITLFYRNLATRVFLNKDDSIFNNIDEFPISKGESNYQFEVEARTLTSILSEIGINHIDFISLDVEGYELEVLQGLDFNKTNVNYILIETNQKSIIEEYLYQFEFKIIDKLSHHDYLFQRRIRDLNP